MEVEALYRKVGTAKYVARFAPAESLPILPDGFRFREQMERDVELKPRCHRSGDAANGASTRRSRTGNGHFCAVWSMSYEKKEFVTCRFIGHVNFKVNINCVFQKLLKFNMFRKRF